MITLTLKGAHPQRELEIGYPMQEFIAYIIKNIVSKPEAVVVHESTGEQTMIIEIHAAAEDVAKVIGKQGRTIKAIRTIAGGVGARLGRQVRIEVIQ